MLQALEAVDPALVRTLVTMPCHIIDEQHNGFAISNSASILGIYRCQGYWWGKELREGDIEVLQSSNPNEVHQELEHQYAIQLAPFPGDGAFSAASAVANVLRQI